MGKWMRQVWTKITEDFSGLYSLADTDSKITFALETSLHHNTSLTSRWSRWSHDTCLLLSFRYFLNENTIPWMATSVGVSKLMACDALSSESPCELVRHKAPQSEANVCRHKLTTSLISCTERPTEIRGCVLVPSFIVNSSFDCNGTSIKATRWSITPLFAKADKITNLSILYLFSFRWPWLLPWCRPLLTFCEFGGGWGD